MTDTKILPGATIANGVQYLPGTKGMLIPVANLKPQDVLQHELVYQLTDYSLDLSAEIARFNGHSRADLAAFDALLAQEYGVTRDPEFKGNRTYTSADGKRQVKIQLADRVSYGAELQQAKALLDELIRENAGGAGPVLTPLVNLAFRVDKEGKVDPNLLRAIKRLEIPDERWPRIVKAINDAERPLDTASYVRFYQAGPTGKMELIPLDIACAFPTPEAFARRSLRRQLQQLTDTLQAAFARIPDFPTTDPVAGVEHLVDWVLGLDPKADADDQAGDDAPFHIVVGECVAARQDVYALPVVKRLAVARHLSAFAKDIIADLVKGNGIDAFAAQQHQDELADIADDLRDVMVKLGTLIEHLHVAAPAADAAE